MKIIDISLTINKNLPIWPGDSPIILERVNKMEDGANANVTHLSAGVHMGTHVDAPFHFLGGDFPTVESLPLDVLTGPAEVFSLPEVDLVTVEALARINIPLHTERLLLKTKNSDLWSHGESQFQEDYVGLDVGAAQFLIQRGVKLIGVDYLSVAPYDDPRPTHQVLLEAGVVIVEGLDFSRVEPGGYQFYCLPLKIEGSDGAPARAILVSV